jgi:hypothetical protein
MYNEKCNIEVVTVGEDVIVYGLNLQSSYPKQTVELEYPEMYCLFPIL